ncbi:MAG: VTT domain-containing protein [Acidobacteria bacterium]|nr:VTT domain-containing protein [Acidobacteriota bacterium]
MKLEKGTWGWVWRLLLTLVIIICAVVLYRQSGFWESPERLREFGFGARGAAVIIIIMACAWALALPASALLIVTPLIFPPHLSTLITTTGCAIGAGVGYAAARFVGGPSVERFRGGRLWRFLKRHSSFLALFGIRLTPGVPHGFINYVAGLARVPFFRFMAATTIAMAIKSYVYALAVHSTVEVQALSDALSARTLLSFLAVGLLALGGHLLQQRFARAEVTALPAAE